MKRAQQSWAYPSGEATVDDRLEALNRLNGELYDCLGETCLDDVSRFDEPGKDAKRDWCVMTGTLGDTTRAFFGRIVERAGLKAAKRFLDSMIPDVERQYEEGTDFQKHFFKAMLRWMKMERERIGEELGDTTLNTTGGTRAT